MKQKELEDLYSVLTAGGRNSGEKSQAQPQRFYRDPAESAEFPAEVARKQKVKQEKARKLKNQKQSKHRNYRRK